MTGPGKTGLIYTKYTCLYYGIYLLFCMYYPNSVSCIEFLMDFCIYDDILDTVWITDKKLNSQNQVKFYVQIRPVSQARSHLITLSAEKDNMPLFMNYSPPEPKVFAGIEKSFNFGFSTCHGYMMPLLVSCVLGLVLGLVTGEHHISDH